MSMLTQEELFYVLALQRVPNLGDTSAKKMLHYVGSAKEIFSENKNSLLKIDGIGAFKLKDLHNKSILDDAEEELQFINDNKIEYTFYKDDSYSENLKHCLDGPILLFQRGNIDLKNKKIISIVGTRKVTTHGVTVCKKLIEELAPLNPIIVSGFAYGVDITAHSIAMDCGLQTIACLAHGLNQIYPKTHKKYCNKVEENGGFITEFWSSDAFDRNNFLKRNRIIAGLSEATIVIESAEKGGSLVTADIANSYSRDVFAFPGKATDIQSQGCNNLIKSQQAQLITSAADVIYQLGWEIIDAKPKIVQKQLFVELTEEENKVYNFLKDKGKSLLDTIAIGCNIPAFTMASILLAMELKGLVRPLPGKLFELI